MSVIIGRCFLVQAIVAGDDRDKGLSIVDLQGGELTCIKPEVTDFQWSFVMDHLRNNFVFDVRYVTSVFDTFRVGSNPSCPYK